MRGVDWKQEAMFSYVSPEQRVPPDHPLRPIREMVDQALQEMSPRLARLYAQVGRPSIAPERLLLQRIVHQWQQMIIAAIGELGKLEGMTPKHAT